MFVSLVRVVEDAMGGQYLNSSFALPCPPGIDVPPEIVSPFTSSSLKVRLPESMRMIARGHICVWLKWNTMHM